jgi:hypothetical protein
MALPVHPTPSGDTRPALLTLTAVAGTLLGGAGVLGYAWLFLQLNSLAGYEINALSLLVYLPIIGPFLIILTTLRWGIAVFRDRPTMAYFPGRVARTGRYGAVTGVLMILASLPFGYFLFVFPIFAFEGVNPFQVLYAAVMATAIGMIAFARRLNRAGT